MGGGDPQHLAYFSVFDRSVDARLERTGDRSGRHRVHVVSEGHHGAPEEDPHEHDAREARPDARE